MRAPEAARPEGTTSAWRACVRTACACSVCCLSVWMMLLSAWCRNRVALTHSKRRIRTQRRNAAAARRAARACLHRCARARGGGIRGQASCQHVARPAMRRSGSAHSKSLRLPCLQLAVALRQSRRGLERRLLPRELRSAEKRSAGRRQVSAPQHIATASSKQGGLCPPQNKHNLHMHAPIFMTNPRPENKRIAETLLPKTRAISETMRLPFFWPQQPKLPEALISEPEEPGKNEKKYVSRLFDEARGLLDAADGVFAPLGGGVAQFAAAGPSSSSSSAALTAPWRVERAEVEGTPLTAVRLEMDDVPVAPDALFALLLSMDGKRVIDPFPREKHAEPVKVRRMHTHAAVRRAPRICVKFVLFIGVMQGTPCSVLAVARPPSKPLCRLPRPLPSTAAQGAARRARRRRLHRGAALHWDLPPARLPDRRREPHEGAPLRLQVDRAAARPAARGDAARPRARQPALCAARRAGVGAGPQPPRRRQLARPRRQPQGRARGAGSGVQRRDRALVPAGRRAAPRAPRARARARGRRVGRASGGGGGGAQ